MLLRPPPFLAPIFHLPFNTSIGLNEDMKNAGYSPASKPTTSGMAMIQGRIMGEKSMEGFMDLSASVLKPGIKIKLAKMATAREMMTIRVDSDRNCKIRSLRRVPKTLRIPTSRARLADRAVVRFIKLIQAMSRMKIATAEKIYTY